MRNPGSVATLATVLIGTVAFAAPAGSQKTFATPEAAVEALTSATSRNDTAALLQLFGPEGKDIVESGDAAEDKQSRAHFVELAHQRTSIIKDSANPDRMMLVIGTEDWPFPVPLVRAGGQWRFDSSQARVEILARRIGANELNAMEICRGYVEAQMDYAARTHDGKKVLQYAQKIDSSPGKQDGLYWAPAAGAPEPAAPKTFAAAAAANYGSASSRPHYHGYYFRVLKAQGPDATGGALNYVVKDAMMGGFALVAWPAEYGVSGVHTFIISHHGVLYEKDLGANTAALARQMTRFNPDKSWQPVRLE